MDVLDWVGTVTLADEKGLKTVMRYFIPNEPLTPYDSAKASLDAIVAELDPITDATIAQVTLTQLTEADDALGAPNSDVSDEAAIVVYINETGTLPKYHTIRVPAPVDGIFEADLITVDRDDADLVAYVAALAEHTEVSDGEQINTALGEDGMKSGEWRSVKKNPK